MKLQLPCPLCANEASEFYPHYYHCPVCDLRFLNPTQHLDINSEKARYDLHNNNFEDPNYRNFLSPLAEAVKPLVAKDALGLDFGAGPAPVLADILKQMGFETHVYDPFYHAHPEVLRRAYDFICASEVVEHFYKPLEEFRKLRSLLKPGGVLAVMTAMYTPQIDFASWYYRKDPTHVVFFSQNTFHWLAKNLGFKSPTFKSDRIILLQT